MSKTLPRLTTTLSLAALALTSAQAGAANWKYAIEESLSEVQGVYATKFKEVIEANSDHKVQIYPFGTLGESVDVMEQAQAGLLQFVDQSPGFTGSLIP
ncbi:C4-dicarboxylate ABC transporter, partial [Zobellella taiwanensis]